LNFLNISSEDSNDIKKMKEAAPVQPKVISSKVEKLITEDKIVPVGGFTKAMIKTMTASLVSIKEII
jgi:hypothetical protein